MERNPAHDALRAAFRRLSVEDAHRQGIDALLNPETFAGAELVVAKAADALAGVNPMIQGYVLCDLMAAWVASHKAFKPPLNDEFRASLLEQQFNTILELIPANEALLGRPSAQA